MIGEERYMNGKRKTRGFTLMELMIVIAVVGILTMIAYPSYLESVRKTRRNEMKAHLVEIADRMEKCHTINNSYVNCFPADTLTAPLDRSPQNRPAAERMYDLALSGVGVNTFLLTAEPHAGSDQETDTCEAMTINHQGVKEAEGTPTDCW
jgi:type IV pilus assembly protein PilE